MADERLRRLERRFKETGAVEDEVLYLREQIRCGGLGHERLQVAAQLRHAASTVILEGEVPTEFDNQVWQQTLAGEDRSLNMSLS